MHKKGENHCSRDGIQGIKYDTNLALYYFSTLSLQNRVVAEVQEVTEVIYFVAFPVFDSTLQLVDSGSMVFLLHSLVRSGHNRFGCCFTFFEVMLFFKVEVAF